MVDRTNHVKGLNTRLIKSIYICMGMNVIVVLTCFFCFTHRLAPEFYSTSVNDKVELLTAMDMPNTSDQAVTDWASLVAISCFSFDFVNYQKQLNSLSVYFTENGWVGFTNSLKQSNIVDAVIGKKLIVNAVITKSPVILEKGSLNGQYAWRVQIPLLVTYQAASDFSSENILINILVRRISTLDSYKGIGIEQFSSGHYDVFDA